MLNNAGKKIILWSRILLYVGIAVSVAVGFFMIWNGAQTNTYRIAYYHTGALYGTGMLSGGRTIILGFLVIIFGSLLSWLFALLMRAFGDLVTDTRAIREQLECACYEAAAVEAEPVAPEAPAEVQAEAPAEKPAKPRTRRPAKPKAEAADEEPETK